MGLESVSLMLADLPEVAEEWDRMPDGERVSWSSDWDQLMGTDLFGLDARYREGAMTPEQEVAYEELKAGLEAALPTIEELNLYRPTAALG
jgi:hypothetical protein